MITCDLSTWPAGMVFTGHFYMA